MNNLNYEKYEVLVTDDGSTDETRLFWNVPGITITYA